MNLKSLNDLQSKLKTIQGGNNFIVYGNDKRVVNDSINTMYKLINDFKELNLIKLKDEQITLDNIMNSCETVPFMSDIKLVHIFNPPFFSSSDNNVAIKEIKDYLINYIKGKSESTILLITCNEELSETDKLLAAFKSDGYVLKTIEPKGEELHKWLFSLFDRYSKTISKADIFYLVSEIGHNMNTLENEIEKICSFALEEDTIKRNHIDAVVTKTLENSIFKMVDNMARKNLDAAMAILDTLLFQKEDPLRILGMIARQFRLLYQIKLLKKDNLSAEEIMKKLKLRDFAYQNLYKQLEGYDEKKLKTKLEKCLDIDSQIKSGKLEQNFALEMLVVEMCKA